ncbi:unnamed protein product [Linum trigynum]|uniref:Chromo domain-containing protein n=1 Tax=Linum trigynum TaxID=586398 RepID=A0AAV2FKJ9_9ROSI
MTTGYKGNNPSAYKFAQSWHEKMKMTKSYLARATRKMKKWTDKKRRHLEFDEGDLVMVKFFTHRFKHLKNVHKGLLRRYEGPYPIFKRIGTMTNKVELPSHLAIHPIFHVSQLKSYHEDKKDEARKELVRAPTLITTTHEHEIEKIIAHRVVPRHGIHPNYLEYLIKWKGHSESDITWEKKLSLWRHKDLIKACHVKTAKRAPRD